MRIYATCRCCKDLTESERETIRALCSDVAGVYGPALFRFLTTPISLPGCVQRYRVPEGVLRRARREFYRRYEKA